MPGAPFTYSALGLDLSPRIAASTTVAASPSAATETVIASVTTPGGLSYATGIIVTGWAALTVGTSGASVRLRIRQTSISGTVIVDTGALSATAGNLYAQDIEGLDTSPGDKQVYALTLTVGSAAAASTVSAVMLRVLAV